MSVVLSGELVSVLSVLLDHHHGDLEIGAEVVLVVVCATLLNVRDQVEPEVDVGVKGPWRVVRVL